MDAGLSLHSETYSTHQISIPKLLRGKRCRSSYVVIFCVLYACASAWIYSSFYVV